MHKYTINSITCLPGLEIEETVSSSLFFPLAYGTIAGPAFLFSLPKMFRGCFNYIHGYASTN